MAAFASLLLMPITAAWLAFRPSPLAFWAVAGSLVAILVLSLVEQAIVKKADLQTPGPAFLARHWWAASAVALLSAIAALGFFFAAFGSAQMAGSGMVPTLEPGERLFYSKFVDPASLKPGTLVYYKNPADSAWGEPGWFVVARVLAGPGDKLSIQDQDGVYLVNGVAGPRIGPTGDLSVALDVPVAPETLTVPEGCYFIGQDSPEGSFDSRVLSWARAEDIVSTRFWCFGGRGIFQPVP